MKIGENNYFFFSNQRWQEVDGNKKQKEENVIYHDNYQCMIMIS